MIHRYGRYGPDAWKRLRKRRITQEKLSSPSLALALHQGSSLIPSSPSSVHTERIIIVIIYIAKGTIVNALPEPEQAHIRYFAEADAQRKAAADYQRLDEVLTASETAAYAEDLWIKNEYDRTDPEVRKEAIALRGKETSARDVYVQEFTTVYARELVQKGIKQWDGETKAILSQARADKTFDKEHHLSLSEQERIAQAAIRVHIGLGIDPRQERGKLHSYIQVYDTYYQRYQPGQEGGDGAVTRPNGFRMVRNDSADENEA